MTGNKSEKHCYFTQIVPTSGQQPISYSKMRSTNETNLFSICQRLSILYVYRAYTDKIIYFAYVIFLSTFD